MRSIGPWELLSKALPDSRLEDFDFGMPLIRKSADDDTTGRRYIEGVASTPDKDLQDEYVIQKGLDVKYFKKHGYFNNDHKPGFENKVGQPTDANIKRVKDRSGKSLIGLWVRGYLWPKGSHKIADDIWELAHALESAGADRRLGFSIQGKVLKREGNRIIKSWIQDVAVTPSPVNTATWMDVVNEMTKSQWATTQDVDAVRKSIGAGSFNDEPLIGDPDLFKDGDEKALAAGYGTGPGELGTPTLAPESLEDKQKLALNLMDESDSSVAKAIQFAYQQWRRRGHGAEFSRKMACATVAKSLLA